VEMKCTPYCHHCELRLEWDENNEMESVRLCAAENPKRELMRMGKNDVWATVKCNISPYRLLKEATEIAGKAFRDHRDAVCLMEATLEIIPDNTPDEEAVHDAENLD